MAKIKANVKKGPQPVGKRPTRVPLRGSSAAPSSAASTPTGEKPSKLVKRSTSTIRRSTHRMTTRARSKTFPFMDLPPEIRNLVYEHSYASTDIAAVDDHPAHDTARETKPTKGLELRNFKLPQILAVSQAFRSEALPVFFASNTFVAKFRSNWCVRHTHYHNYRHKHYGQTGLIDLSPFIREGQEGLQLPEGAVRIQKIHFSVRCACCMEPVEIGVVDLDATGRKPRIDHRAKDQPKRTNSETKQAWDRFVEDVEKVLERIGKRQYFNGFTVDDIKEIAMCFRHGRAPQIDDESDEDDEHGETV